MNKYYKLTNLLLLIALVFGSFFVWKDKTSSLTPALKIVTAEGNAEHLKDFEFYGYLSNNEVYGNDESFHIKENQTNYLAELPLSKRLDNSLDPLTNELIEDYRSFMRGKYPSSKNFLSTDDFIIYVAQTTDSYWKETKMNELVIAVLNKETKEEEEFTVSLGNLENYYDLYSSHLNYPKVSLVLSKYTTSDQGKHAIYEFNIEDPEAGLTEVYDFTEKIAANESYRVEEVADRTSRFIPLRTTRDVTNTEVEMMTELASYFVYDIKENKMIDIPLFETDTLLLTDHETIYVAEDLGSTLNFYEMNLENEKLEELGEVQLQSPSMGRIEDIYSYDRSFNPNIIVLDGKLYTFEQELIKDSFLPVFQIVDLKTQETLFLGRLDQLDDPSDRNISIGVTSYRLNKLKN